MNNILMLWQTVMYSPICYFGVYAKYGMWFTPILQDCFIGTGASTSEATSKNHFDT